MTDYLYVIGNNTDKQKIGFSKDVNKRLKTLQTGNPDELKIHYTIECPSEKTRKLEKKIHTELSYKKLKGEWFAMSPTEAINYLEFARITWLNDSNIYNY